MNTHYTLSDTEFENQFINCNLDPSIFNHAAHLRLAWIYIKKYGLAKAEELIQDQLKKYVAHVGAKDKYHTTLTIVAVKAVAHFIQQSNQSNFKEFIKMHPQLISNFKGLINSHYSFDIFVNDKARKVYLEPDVSAF